VDWSLAETNADFLRFTRMMIALRKRHSALRRTGFLRGRGPHGHLAPDVIWHGVEPFVPDFSAGSRTLAFCLDGAQTGREPDNDLYVACNAWKEVVGFRVPPSPSGRPWRRVVDTARPSPEDIVEWEEAREVARGERYPVLAHSLVVFVA
jgi:glycogen operon protein